MEFMMELWKPILVSGFAVFVVSALCWTVLPHHRKEYTKLPNEDATLAALRVGNPAPGLYSLPWASGQAEMGTPEFIAKMGAGPTAFLTVRPPGMPPMGPLMAKSLVSNIVIAVFIAYVCFHSLQPGADYLAVFRVAGAVTFIAYGLGTVPESVWFGRPWSSYLLGAFDALLYGLVAGGVFGWLWP